MTRCKQLANSLSKEEKAQVRQVMPALTWTILIAMAVEILLIMAMEIFIAMAVKILMTLAGEGAGREAGTSKKGAHGELCQARGATCRTEKG